MRLGDSSDGSSPWAPASHVGDMLGPGPALALAAIWAVSQQREAKAVWRQDGMRMASGLRAVEASSVQRKADWE